MQRKNNKLLAVESIRGLACFMVVLSHLSLTFFPYLHNFGFLDPKGHEVQSFLHHSPFAFFFSGTAAVSVFFVLSGFILTKVALKASAQPDGMLSMGLKRYPRLMIPALASCMLAYVAFEWMKIQGRGMGFLFSYGQFDYSLLGAIYSGAIDCFFVSGRSPYNPVLWTMKVELIGSFFIYLLCFNKVSMKAAWLPGALIALILGLTAARWIGGALGLGLVSFYGGYLFCLHARPISWTASIFILLAGLYLAGAHNDSASYFYIHQLVGQYTYEFCNFLSGFLIVYAILFNKETSALISGRVFVFMGQVSFSVYLIHLPIIAVFGTWCFGLFMGQTGDFVQSAMASSVVTIGLTYACAFLFYKVVDLRGMRISNAWAAWAITALRAR